MEARREARPLRGSAIEQLLEVPGVGAAKAERYGERILGVVR